MSLPCVRGGAARSAAEGLCLYRNYLSFLLCNFHTFTIPQALPRQLPLHKGAFFVCANIAKKFCCFRRAGAYGMPPYGVRFLPERRATNGRPYSVYPLSP